MPSANKTKYAILGALSFSPMSGYDIKKFCDSSVAHFWNENYARIYPVLKELERDGLVTKTTEQTPGRPSKNVFTISGSGRSELDHWLLQPVEDLRPREELLLKLFFSENVPIKNLVRKIQAEKEKNQTYIEEYCRIEQCLKTDDHTKNERGLPLWLSTLRYGTLYREAIIKWCDETLESMGSTREVTEGIRYN